MVTVAVAAANGSSDDAKGVATFAGAGVTRYRTALVWGTAATFAGALAALGLTHALTTLFPKGSSPPTHTLVRRSPDSLAAQGTVPSGRRLSSGRARPRGSML